MLALFPQLFGHTQVFVLSWYAFTDTNTNIVYWYPTNTNMDTDTPSRFYTATDTTILPRI